MNDLARQAEKTPQVHLDNKQVEKAISELEAADDRLTGSINALTGRLRGVLLNEPSPMDPEKTDPCLVPIASQIYQIKEHTNLNSDRINSLLDRLELSG